MPRFWSRLAISRSGVAAGIYVAILMMVAIYALDENDYAKKLAAAGFENIDIEAWRVYDTQETGAQGKFASAFIRGTRPAR